MDNNKTIVKKQTSEKEVAIEVKNLLISFRTNNGTVKAVRDISFSVNKGETLAIVGESGSGKSVTARAIMGIQAGNSITEGGEIFFNGLDLTKISEYDFHDIRGNCISMVFQDPFSSLNQIMKVGKQLTEAMILNGRIKQREARRNFNRRLKNLKLYVDKAVGSDKNAVNFDKLKNSAKRGSILEREYNFAHTSIIAQITAIDAVLIDIIRGEPKAICRDIELIIKRTAKCYHQYLVKRDKSGIQGILDALGNACRTYISTKVNAEVKNHIGKLRDIFQAALELPTPDFFALGYYMTYNSGSKIPTDNITDVNRVARKFMDENFLDGFWSALSAGLKHSADESKANKKKTLDEINAKLPLLDNDNTSTGVLKAAVRHLIKTVEASIDPLAINKNSFAYAFRSGCSSGLENYLFMRKQVNKKKLKATELEVYRDNLKKVLFRLCDEYREQSNSTDERDYTLLAKRTVDKLKDDASKMVYKVTNSLAKSRAISLMEEVGIPEARVRYKQYPFQFSGGMRQRVVIAIALAANPDVLLCDEPSTALDVTIQAQILDLINSLKVKRQLSVIFITHDLGVVANVADHVAVMYAGKIVEYGTVDDVFLEPAHPYTWALLSSMPDLNTKEKLDPIPGTPPNMIFPPKGDAFAARNKYAIELDFEEEPPFFDVSPTHKAATWLLHPDAPKIEPPRIVTERIAVMHRMKEEVLRQQALGIKEITIDGVKYSTNTVLE